jgi:transcriptional regulator with XRE-family HTH domain
VGRTVKDITELREAIRKNFGSESKFARHIGLKKQILSRYLRGERTPPIEIILKISDATGQSSDVLIPIFLAAKSPNGG